MVRYIEAKGAHWVLENPISSLLWMYAPVRATLQREGVYRSSVPLGQGSVSERPGLMSSSSWLTLRKRVTLFTNASWLCELGVRMDPERADRLRTLQREKKIKIIRRYEELIEHHSICNPRVDMPGQGRPPACRRRQRLEGHRGVSLGLCFEGRRIRWPLPAGRTWRRLAVRFVPLPRGSNGVERTPLTTNGAWRCRLYPAVPWCITRPHSHFHYCPVSRENAQPLSSQSFCVTEPPAANPAFIQCWRLTL